ncbi:MAG TPA: efflux RND transporter periplasmic adaptor subunit [Pirellulales bacterium]|nr:efflux RND transporter periplasmic adaptor subunit [Pirellulales bacterium]
MTAFVMVGCHEKADPPWHATERPTVQLTHPELRTIVRNVGQSSVVGAYERTSLYPKVNGFIEKCVVDVGDKVKRGDLLATLFAPELVEDCEKKRGTVEYDKQQIELALAMVKIAKDDVVAAQERLGEAKTRLGDCEAEVECLSSDVDRLTREGKKGIVDPQVLLESQAQLKSTLAERDTAIATVRRTAADLACGESALIKDKLTVDVARADLLVAQSEERRLKAGMAFLTVNSPYDGIIEARTADSFDFALLRMGAPRAMPDARPLSPTNAAPLYVVDRTDVVRVFVDIPENDANYVQIGTKASVRVRELCDEEIPAAVTRTGGAIDVTSHTLRAEIDLPNTDGKILPGMCAYANVTIRHPDVWALCNTDLNSWDGRTFYWTVDNGRTVRMEVQTGVSDGEWTELTNHRLLTEKLLPWRPIDGSQPVIDTSDASILTEGQKVRIAHSAGNEEKKAGQLPPIR